MQAGTGAGDPASGPPPPRVIAAEIGPPATRSHHPGPAMRSHPHSGPAMRSRYGEYVPPRPSTARRGLAVAVAGLVVLLLLVMGTVALVAPW